MKRARMSRFATVVALAASVLLVPAAGFAGASPAPQRPPAVRVALQQKFITSAPGISIYLRHKFAEPHGRFTKDRIVLFLEPYSVPTAMAFDVPGYSWMNAYAREGFDTWAMDFRGFGWSTRPASKPVVRYQTGAQDLAAVVNYIEAVRHVRKIDIVGWSWGGVVAAYYAGKHPGKVNKLVLDGFMHGFSLPMMASMWADPQDPSQFNPNMPAYPLANWAAASVHWYEEMGGHQWATAKAIEAVSQVYTASDPLAATQAGQVRRPVGPLMDLFSIWTGHPLYSLAPITAPTLVIRGSADYMAEGCAQGTDDVLQQLTDARWKKEIVIPNATHWSLYETAGQTNSHRILLRDVKQFLEQAIPAGS